MKTIKGKKWVLIILVVTAIGMGAFMAANYIVDPVDYFAATGDKKTYNPNNYTRKIKTEYILKRFPDVEGVILGGSKAGVLDPERIRHYTGLSYYNLSLTHGNFSDYETWTRYLAQHLDNLKEVTIHLSSIEGGYYSWYRDITPDPMTDVPALMKGNLWNLITENLGNLCTDIRTTFEAWRNPDKGITRDTLATGQKNWRAAIRSYEKDPEAYLEKNFFSSADHSLKNLFTRSARDRKHYYQENLDALVRIRDFCSENGITLKVIVGASHIFERYQYECEEYLRYLKHITMITGGIWDFSSYSSLNLNPCNFYERRHYTTELGNLETDIMYGAADSADYDNFGIWLTPENVDAYIKQRMEDWARLKEEYDATGKLELPGADDPSCVLGYGMEPPAQEQPETDSGHLAQLQMS